VKLGQNSRDVDPPLKYSGPVSPEV
jgi:hypothetical protein